MLPPHLLTFHGKTSRQCRYSKALRARMASAGAYQTSRVISAQSPPIKTERDAPCAVCRRPQCQLQSHTAYLVHRRRTTKQTLETLRKPQVPDEPQLLDTAYARSYAFTRALPSILPHCISSGRLDGFHDLPVPGGHQPELHHAVYSCESICEAFPVTVCDKGSKLMLSSPIHSAELQNRCGNSLPATSRLGGQRHRRKYDHPCHD